MNAIFWLVGTWAMVLGVAAWLAWISGPEVTSEQEPAESPEVVDLLASPGLVVGYMELADAVYERRAEGGRHAR